MSGDDASDAGGQMSGDAAGDEPSILSPGLTAMVCEPGDDEKLAERIRDGWKPRWPKVRLRIRAPEWVILHFRQLETAFQRSGCGGSFTQFLVLGFWAVWAPVLGQSNECEPITRRDRYVCTCPVCGRPAGPWHHVQPKARGGPRKDPRDGRGPRRARVDHRPHAHHGGARAREAARRVTREAGRATG